MTVLYVMGGIVVFTVLLTLGIEILDRAGWLERWGDQFEGWVERIAARIAPKDAAKDGARLVDEFHNGTAEKDWPAWAIEAVAELERASIQNTGCKR